MNNSTPLADCLQAGGVTLERVKYFQRQLLTVDDMVADQSYFIQKMRRHNRFLHGSGVVCGLVVTAAPTAASPWQVQIDAGYALGPYGDEIYVSAPVFLDLATCGPNSVTDPCNPGRGSGVSGVGGVVYVAIEYAECFSQPVQAMPAGCGCEDDGCEYSRIRDGFDLSCLTSLPPVTPVPLICNLIASKVPTPCPPCPTSPWVVLAAVTLPPSKTMNLTNDAINLSVRKPIYRTELLQAQLIPCCCGGTSTVPVTPVAIIPVKVVSDTITAGVSFTTANSPGTFTLTLSKQVQPATVGPASVFVTNGAGNRMAGTVAYNDAARTITFTNPPSALTAGPSVPEPFPVGTYTITAKGSAPNAITDLDILALDGNGDGKGGDDYALKFTVVATNLP